MRFFKETGFLTTEGESLLLGIQGALESLFDTEEVQDLSETEVRLLGSNIMNMVADRVSRRMAFKKQIDNQFSAMSDQEFDTYLEDKYGPRWMLMTLSEEEIARCPLLSKEKIKEAIEQGLRESQPGYHLPPIISGLRFK